MKADLQSQRIVGNIGAENVVGRGTLAGSVFRRKKGMGTKPQAQKMSLN